MSTTRLGPSLAQQTTAAVLAGLTTLTLLWGMVGLADGYRADSALLVRSQPAPGLIQAEVAAPGRALAMSAKPQA